MLIAHDPRTLAFYDREAVGYAADDTTGERPHLAAFLGQLQPGATILELGCGGGHEARIMLDAGFEVTPTDGSAALAGEAARRLGQPVRVMRFDELAALEAYDAVWANACLLHVPEAALPSVLRLIWRALKTGGLFFASYKSGDGGGRDPLGRYNNFINHHSLDDAYRAAGAWSTLVIEARAGGGYDCVPRTWLGCTAVKGGLAAAGM